MALHLDWVAVDCADPLRMARFWAEALDYEVKDEDEDEDEFLLVSRDGSRRRLLFLRVPEPKQVKNRLHFDLRPDDQEAEVARLERLGAKRIDIGQGDATWVVMADPEGNEFCVLRALTEQEKRDVPYGD